MHIRDRIKDLRRVRASEMRPHPSNWRRHPDAQQNTLRGLLAEIGYADTLLVRELPDGTLQLIDGHLRAATTPDMQVPVLVVDLNDQEAAKLLALHDPLAGMAEADSDALASLLRNIETQNEDVQRLMEQLLKDAAESQAMADSQPGFRPGMGSISDGISDWRPIEGFFDCPPEVRAALEAKTQLVIMFSGGKDSSAVLTWTRHNFPDAKCCAIFCDTGVEFPGLGADVAEACEQLNVDLIIVKPVLEWWSWLRRKGRWPSLLYRECAQKMIHTPISEWILANCHPDQTAILTGSRAEEAVRGSQKTATSPLGSLGAKAERYYHFAPCFNVKKPVIEHVLETSGLHLWPGYGQGFVRTACWCCPGQCGLQAAALQDHYPGLADEIRRWERRIGVLRPEEQGPGIGFDRLVERGHRQRERQAVTHEQL